VYSPEARVARFDSIAARMRAWALRFAADRRGNTAMIFALASIAVIGAGGVGVDLARAMVAKNRMAAALDAAALAIGTTQGLTQAQMQTMAQQYFNANYTTTDYGTPGAVVVSISDNAIALSVSSNVPTTILPILGINTVAVRVTNEVTRGLTKLRVALVLDNTGSMLETDSTGTSKISALITATHQLLTTLQNAASHPGDVQVALIPFSKDVNVGTGNVNASWIDWTDWAAAPANGTPSTSVGPGSSCPYTTGAQGYVCQSTPTNGSATASTIPSSGTYAGYICPSVDYGNFNAGRLWRYYNGCYNSVGTTSSSSSTTSNTTTVCTNSSSCTTTAYCSGYPTSSTSSSGNTSTTTTTTCECHATSGPKFTCTRTATAVATTTTVGAPYTHTWIVNNHSTWTGCVMDRNQDYDVGVATPSGSSTNFPAENTPFCVPSVMRGTLGYDWTALNTAVDAMTASGTTNQTIGLVWGWQALTTGAPLYAPAMDSNTTNVIILLSDGMNTQDRWYGDYSLGTNTSVDGRMALACSAAKAAQVQIYTVLVMAGNSTVLQNCASDSSKYFALDTAGEIITTFNQIGQTLANLHLSR